MSSSRAAICKPLAAIVAAMVGPAMSPHELMMKRYEAGSESTSSGMGVELKAEAPLRARSRDTTVIAIVFGPIGSVDADGVPFLH